MKTILKDIIAKAGFRIARHNDRPMQFDGFEDIMRMLRAMGYYPHNLIDGGAHLGAFACQARRFFSKANIHMVEPQRACSNQLTHLTQTDPRIKFYQVLLTASDIAYAPFIESDKPSTGSRVGISRNIVAASSLDQLFGHLHGSTFLKLDLQGHELVALKGGENILRNIVDFALVETSVFVEHHETKLLEILKFMDDRGFDVFDIAAMGRRWRDGRLRQCDIVFAKRDTVIWRDRTWS